VQSGLSQHAARDTLAGGRELPGGSFGLDQPADDAERITVRMVFRDGIRLAGGACVGA